MEKVLVFLGLNAGTKILSGVLLTSSGEYQTHTHSLLSLTCAVDSPAELHSILISPSNLIAQRHSKPLTNYSKIKSKAVEEK